MPDSGLDSYIPHRADSLIMLIEIRISTRNNIQFDFFVTRLRAADKDPSVAITYFVSLIVAPLLSYAFLIWLTVRMSCKK